MDERNGGSTGAVIRICRHPFRRYSRHESAFSGGKFDKFQPRKQSDRGPNNNSVKVDNSLKDVDFFIS